MKYMHGRVTLMVVVIAMSTGCSRIVRWGTDTFYQGENLKDEASGAREYIRSATIYDQLTTDIMVDALWLSELVRTAFVHLHGRLHGYSDERMRALLRRQLEENNHFMDFYVLVPRSLALDDVLVGWSILLDVDGAIYAPIEIKSHDLGPEYREIFGSILTRFKAAYQLKFEALNAEDKPIITPAAKSFALVVRSSTKEARLVWHFVAEAEPERCGKKIGSSNGNCNRS